ncbi:MAG: hypothetical protein GXP25_00480 [Planctomycetes bacterium]|nr:hypothetical protein [Planctomycetota bacterium]
MTRQMLFAFAAFVFLAVMASARGAEDVTMENDLIKVAVHPDHCTFDVLDKRVGYTWRQCANKHIAGAAKSVKRDGDKLTVDLDHLAAGPDKKTAVPIRMILELQGPNLTVTLDGDTDAKIRGLLLPFPFLIDTPRGNIVAGYKEGLLYPVRDVKTFNGKPAAGTMACFGMVDGAKGFGYMAVFDTPHDVKARAATCDVNGEKLLGVHISWEPQKGAIGYPRRVIYHFSDSGHHTPLAKFYRKIVKAKGMVLPFREKKKEALSRFAGAVNVHGADEMEIRTLKKIGVERALINSKKYVDLARELGYIPGRYDIYMDVLDPQFATSKWMKKQGTVLGWDFPADLLKKADGSTITVGYRVVDPKTKKVRLRYRPCATACLRVMGRDDRAKGEIERNRYGAYFLDVTTAMGLMECYDPKHPLTRTEDAKVRRKQFGFLGGLNDGVIMGSEAGHDWALPECDYFEGIMSTVTWSFGIKGLSNLSSHSKLTPTELYNEIGYGEKRRIPLWELVYGDAVVTTWWWGDNPTAFPDTWQRRNLLNMLYGSMPLWLIRPGGLRSFFYVNMDRFAEAWRHVGRWNRAVGFEELVAHRYLTDDHRVQRSDFGNGLSLIVNFGPEPYTTDDGKAMPQYSYRILGDKEKYPDLPVGEIVQLDPNWSPVDPVFEYTTFGGTSGWTPAPGMQIKRVTDDVRPDPGWKRYQEAVSAMTDKLPLVGSAKVSGKQSGADHFVKTRDIMVLPNAEYRFEAWMKVVRTTGSAPMRFAVVQADRAGKALCTAESSAYDTKKPGEWQRLHVQFTTPAEARKARFVVPKPKGEDIEAELYIDDIDFTIRGFK